MAALDILILFIVKSGWISFKVDGLTRAVWLILQADIWIILLLMLRRERQSTRKLYFTDTLTRGYNRNGFIQAAAKWLALEDCREYVIVNMNIHDFKSINYQLGEKKANQLLVIIYQEMKECIQKEELACRSEMDRFLLFLHKASDESVCSTIKQIVEKVQKMNPDILLNFTVGACRLSEGEKLQDTIHKAGCMMTSSQSLNRCVFYDVEIQKQQKEEQELLYSFEQSIKDKDFLIFLQPVVSPSLNRCLNAEALVRWKHPQKGLLFPNQFIPLFELHNKISQLDLYMFEAVCEIAERWSLNSGTFIETSVNLSRRHLKQKGLMEQYENFLLMRTYSSEHLLKETISSTAMVLGYVLLTTLCVIWVLVRYVKRHILKNLLALNEELEKIEQGNLEELHMETHILEFDTLTYYINQLLKSIRFNSGRLSDIIDSGKLSMGVFEYNQFYKKIFLNQWMRKLFGIDDGQPRSPAEEKQIVLEKLKEIEQNCVDPVQKIYRYDKDEKTIYVKMQKSSDEQSMIYYLTDVSPGGGRSMWPKMKAARIF